MSHRSDAPLALVLAAGLALVGLAACEDPPPKARSADGEVQPPSQTPDAPRNRRTGKTGTYLGAVVRSLGVAEIRMAEANLRQLHKCLQGYALERDGKYPPNLEALVEANLAEKGLITTFDKPHRPLTYVAGQSPSAPAGNVLVYDEAPIYNSEVLVLYNNGTVDRIPPDQLQQELRQTRRNIR